MGHINVIRLEEVILDEKCIFMVFEYAEHDLLVLLPVDLADFQSIIHFHAHARAMTPIPQSTLRSILYQLVRALTYMHQVTCPIFTADIELDPSSRPEACKHHGNCRWMCKSRGSWSRKDIL